MKVLLDYASILLDILAFFLVTTDLYGEKRLQELQGQIKALRVPNGGSALFRFVFDRHKLLWTISSGVSLAFFVLTMTWFYQLTPDVEIFKAHAILKGIAGTVVSILFTLFVGLLFFMLLYILIGFVANVIGAGIKLLQIKPLKSYMLLFGIILFLIGKSIAALRVAIIT